MTCLTPRVGKPRRQSDAAKVAALRETGEAVERDRARAGCSEWFHLRAHGGETDVDMTEPDDTQLPIDHLIGLGTVHRAAQRQPSCNDACKRLRFPRAHRAILFFHKQVIFEQCAYLQAVGCRERQL